MNLTCPCCHATTSLEALTQDEAARELLALRGQLPAATWPQLVAYLGLFRSSKRALAWGRALRLAQEVVDLQADPAALASALFETVEAMRAKREAGDVRPLKNHNYLKRVLETALVTGAIAPIGNAAAGPVPAKQGKRMQAIEALNRWAGDDWLRREVAQGLQALVALSRPGTPGADTIAYTADVWVVALCGSSRLENEEIDARRLHIAFKSLLKQPLKDWPDPAALRPHMPKRPEHHSLPQPARSDEETALGVSAARKIMEDL